MQRYFLLFVCLSVSLQPHHHHKACCVCASTENSIWQGQLCRKCSIEQQLHSAAKDSLLDSCLFYGALRKTAEPTHNCIHIRMRAHAYMCGRTHTHTLVEERIKGETESKSGGGVTNLLFLCLERLEEMSEGCKIILTGRIKTFTHRHTRMLFLTPTQADTTDTHTNTCMVKHVQVRLLMAL